VYSLTDVFCLFSRIRLFFFSLHTPQLNIAQEITYGLNAKPNARIQNWFEQFLSTCQILPLTPEIAQCAGELRGTFRTRGIVRSQADMLIAATAHIHQLTLITRNIRDFEDCSILLLNPFSK
jgi:predicted nucleic acid-binding protein